MPSSTGKVDIDSKAMLAIEPPDGPVVMVNLFRLKDRAKFAEYQQAMGRIAAQAFAALGAENLYSGMVGGEFIAGEEHWDAVALVRYSDWQALCATVADGELLDRLNEVRWKYLDDSRFILTAPLGASLTASRE